MNQSNDNSADLFPATALPTDETESQSQARAEMVRSQIARRDIFDARVLEAMQRVPRHCFVPPSLAAMAHDDRPLPIGHGQTISQPYIVALMTQVACPRPQSKALDLGTGSGYQAAVLSLLCREVYSIEIIEPLAQQARVRLEKLGYRNVEVRTGDGYGGWPEQAPFDLIVVAAAPDHLPRALVEQLATGGRLVIPVGRSQQRLLLVEKLPDNSIRRQTVASVAFVTMTGQACAQEPD